MSALSLADLLQRRSRAAFCDSKLPEYYFFTGNLRARCVMVTPVLSNLIIGGQTSHRTTDTTLAKHSITARVATVRDLSHMPIATGTCVCVYAFMYIGVH